MSKATELIEKYKVDEEKLAKGYNDIKNVKNIKEAEDTLISKKIEWRDPVVFYLGEAGDSWFAYQNKGTAVAQYFTKRKIVRVFTF